MAGKFEIILSSDGKYMFNLKDGDGRVILQSEFYESKAACLNSVESVRKNSVVENRYERRVSSKGEPYFVLKGGNGQVLGISKVYNSNLTLDKMINSTKSDTKDASISKQVKY
jgi:uncharacterized protein